MGASITTITIAGIVNLPKAPIPGFFRPSARVCDGGFMTTADAIIALELGHYRLREQIGGSAYGIIWRASGPQATRDVAIKLINREQMERAAGAARALDQRRQ
jgi:hypothetical protein